jgi:hypothetical protein
MIESTICIIPPKLLIYWLEGSLMQEDIRYPEEYLGKDGQDIDSYH